MKTGKLFIVATPIGNLEDISLRATRILKEVDFILAEDTRTARILLDKYQIKTPLVSYFQHSGFKKINEIVSELRADKNIALISEAGTPGISDPGNKLICEILKSLETEIIPVPGPSAALAALSISGFKTDNFLFLGFLPKKKGRQTLLSKIKSFEYTIVFYESPYRIVKTLQDLLRFLGDREVVVCRELTKKFETIYRGKISEIIYQIKPKGEFTIVIRAND